MKTTKAIEEAIEVAKREGRVTEGNVLSEPFTDEVGLGPPPNIPTPPCPVYVDSGAHSGPVELHLPWPPSLNHYWRHVGNKVLVSEEGRHYRREVANILFANLLQVKPVRLEGRLSVSILAHPPDKRQRDLDNLLKCPLDALQHAGLYESDSQIDLLMIRRGNVRPGGELFVVVRTKMEGDVL